LIFACIGQKWKKQSKNNCNKLPIYEKLSKNNQPIFPTTKQFELSNCFLVVLPSKII
jgi:hypothetical protein